jgi:hypothetical protein
MTDEQIAEKFVPYLPHEIKSELANHFLSQADTVAAIEALNFRQLIDDPDTFLETLNLAKLNKTLFLKTYFKLHDQYQKPLEFLKDSSKDLLIGQPQMGPFCSTTFKELTQIPSTKEYFENIESLLETIESSYSESDATLIFHRLLSSAHIRSTSGFKFDWGFLDFRYLFKHQPWLYKTPDDILTVMNLMHADFSFIESHNAAQGCRFFVPDIAENEVRRHQIRTLLQFQIQYSIFKRICDQSLKTSDDKAVMQFFSIACSKPVANRFHKAYKQHTMRLLFSEGPEKIKAYAQKAFPQWIDQLQCLINSNPDMSKKELMTILNSILLTPHFIFEKAIHDLRSESPDLVVNEQFLTLCANLNHTINNFDDSKFNAFQGNIHEQHLAMISLYLQYTQNISYTEAQKKALSLPRAISQVILSHCNFAFRSFLYQCIEAIESSKTKILNIKFDMDLPEEMTIDLNPLLITGSARHHESSLIKLIEHIDQSVIEHSSQQTNAIRDAVVQTEYYSNWKGPLRQAQISFENGNEPLPGFFTVIKNFFLNLIFQWSTGYRNAREAYQIAADQEYLRAELLRTQFIQDFQRTHPGQPMSNCQRAVMIQEKAGILPRIQPLY